MPCQLDKAQTSTSNNTINVDYYFLSATLTHYTYHPTQHTTQRPPTTINTRAHG